jgi:excisionase family DNA binding protein
VPAQPVERVLMSRKSGVPDDTILCPNPSSRRGSASVVPLNRAERRHPELVDGGGLYDKPQAAAYLGVTERHIERLWAERRITACRVGKFIRFLRSDLDAFIAANRIEAVR